MKLIIAEEQENQLRPERAFTVAVIKVGRDPAECPLVFEQAKWPMVSRRHAEIRVQNGRCFLADLNSSFGTLLDGKRISGTVEAKLGSRIQFGLGGPIIRLVRLENTAALSDSDFGAAETDRDIAKQDLPVRNAPAASPSYQSPSAASYQPPASASSYPQPPQPAGFTPSAPVAPPAFAPLSAPPAFTPAPPPAPTPSSAPAPLPLRAPSQQAMNLSSAAPPSQAAPVSSEVFLEHLRGGTGVMAERVRVGKANFTIGREPSMDLIIDLDAAVVSRRHAEIKHEDNRYLVYDLGSFNGTLVNEQRITAPTPLYNNDQIQLGPGGPLLRFVAPAYPAPAGSALPAQRAAVSAGIAPATPTPMPAAPATPHRAGASHRDYQGTMVLRPGSVEPPSTTPVSNDQLLLQVPFNGRTEITVGRATENTIRLDGLQISNRHARIVKDATGLTIEDTGSTNGIYINGKRLLVNKLTPFAAADLVQIGPFRLKADAQTVAVFDTRSKTRLDVIDIIKRVPNRSGVGEVTLLDDVDLTIQPNEFIGLLGPSGAGKSTLMDAMNGMRPATKGQILINGLNLYEHLDSFKQSIGYVPQEDIIHRELTVYRTLYYVAKLRLSRDVSDGEIDQIISEVLDVTGLSERRDVLVSQLSGGQRKRVSIAVELITKPSIIYLDEPTSGLDPATEEKIMRLFRQIAESGRTVVLTTHAMENVKLFDKIVVLMRGKLIWYGPPMDALKHFKAESFKDLYDKIEAPISQFAGGSKAQREEAVEQVANNWRKQFEATPQHRQLIHDPLNKLKGSAPPPVPVKRTGSVTDSLRQLRTLARRYKEVLFRDKLNLLILFGQAPIIGLLTALVTGAKDPRDFPLFMLSLVAIWFGTSVASREIIRERPVYNRERMVNLGLLPYVGSKLLVLSAIVTGQCVLLFLTLKLLDLLSPAIAALRPESAFTMPGYLFGLPQLVVMILTGIVGIMIGLFISAIVKTSEMATSLVPLILIPQLLFAGLVGLPTGLGRVVGAIMPATWSFDEMKRLSNLEVLRGVDEGGAASPNRKDGKGLLKQLELENQEKIDEARNDFKQYKRRVEQDGRAFKRKMVEYANARAAGDNSVAQPEDPELPDAPLIKPASVRPDSLRGYIDFLHPWGNLVLNPLILLLMFGLLLAGTLKVLRSQDI